MTSFTHKEHDVIERVREYDEDLAEEVKDVIRERAEEKLLEEMYEWEGAP